MALEAINNLGYYVDNPSAWDHFNQSVSDAIEAALGEAREIETENARLREALRQLSFAAQTTGGTAGRDESLVAAIEKAHEALATAPAESEVPGGEDRTRRLAHAVERLADSVIQHGLSLKDLSPADSPTLAGAENGLKVATAVSVSLGEERCQRGEGRIEPLPYHPDSEQAKADMDMISYGTGYMRGGKHVPIERVQREPEKRDCPLGGRWHYGNGALVCGTIRVAILSPDTDPPQETVDQLGEWMAQSLNESADDAMPENPWAGELEPDNPECAAAATNPEGDPAELERKRRQCQKTG